jgi:prephenate dehydrogenase
MDKTLIKQQAARLLMEISLTEKEALTEKLATVIEKFREDSDKSHELASTVFNFFETLLHDESKVVQSFATQNTTNAASKEDIGLLMLEIQRLRKDIEDLKQQKPNV